MQDEGHRNARGDILRYAGGNVHDGDGALHPFLREVGGESRLLSFMSMMADKKVGKETFVLIYDSIYKNKFLSWKQSDRTEKLSCTAMTEQA